MIDWWFINWLIGDILKRYLALVYIFYDYFGPRNSFWCSRANNKRNFHFFFVKPRDETARRDSMSKGKIKRKWHLWCSSGAIRCHVLWRETLMRSDAMNQHFVICLIKTRNLVFIRWRRWSNNFFFFFFAGGHWTYISKHLFPSV